MEEIKKEDLVRQLKEKADIEAIIDEDAVDFVLWKLNEIRQEIGLKLKNREQNTILKDSS